MSMETKNKFHQNPCIITIQKEEAYYVMSLFEDVFFRNQEYDIIKNGKSIKTIKRKIYSLIHDFKFQEKAKNPEREREREREKQHIK